VKEADLAKLIPTVEQFAGQYDVFVLPGFNFGGIGDIVLANPDKYFLVVDSTIQDSEGQPVTADNVYTMTYKEQEGGFMAGVAAALTTKTNKVTEINGIAFPSNVNYEYGFIAGVNYANAKYGTAAE
ncbi:BMP family ABC transporter substrate-binding protein, partial [Vibrio sp. FNV 38]|nr:BMP family ABC transporter substrate-binding protein [Vibrio sp. FNV 38]